MTTNDMSTEDKVRALTTMTTRDEAGRHFTERYGRDTIDALEAEGLITTTRPVHDATGIPYSEEYWSVEVTEAGIELVEAYPEFHEQD